MIKITSCNIKYDKVLIENSHISIYNKEITLIIGKNGTGKTALLYLLGLIDKNDSQYWFDDVHINDCNEKQLANIRKNNIGYVFQENNLLTHLTIYENFQYYGKLLDKDFSYEQIVLHLKRFNLDIDLNKYPNQISGGQKQRVAIALAIIKKPKLLILDEPTSALDEKNSNEIILMLKDIKEKLKCMIVVVSHNKSMLKVADTIYKIENKKILCVKENDNHENFKFKLKDQSLPFNNLWYSLKYIKHNLKFYLLIIFVLTGAILTTSLADNYFKNYINRFKDAINQATVNEIIVQDINDTNDIVKQLSKVQNIEDIIYVKFKTYSNYKINESSINELIKIQNYTKYQPLNLNSSNIETNNSNVYADYQFAKKNNIKENDIISIHTEEGEYQLKITGILIQGYNYQYDSLEPPDLYIPDQYAILERTNNINIYCTEANKIKETAEDIAAILNVGKISYETEKIEAYTDIIYKTTIITKTFSWVLIIITIIITLMLFYKNTQLRKYEFAILRANGLTNNNVLIISNINSLLILLAVFLGTSIIYTLIVFILQLFNSAYITLNNNSFILIGQLSILAVTIPTLFTTTLCIKVKPSKILRN